MSSNETNTLSHRLSSSGFLHAFNEAKTRIQKTGDKPHVTVKTQLTILDELSAFEWGRFLIEHKGLNGYWTHYMLTYPNFKKELHLSGLEHFMLARAPSIIATQERHQHFLQEDQEKVFEGAKLACLPSGLMGELLSLDFSNISTIHLYGFDSDKTALNDISALAESQGISHPITTECIDAWHFDKENAFDLISSNGLTVYQPDQHKNIALYQRFYKALRPGGKLVTSFLTPPPNHTLPSEWDLKKINQDDLLHQQIIFNDVLAVNWQNYITSLQMETIFAEIGFCGVRFLSDGGNIFPTIVAYKPE